MLIFTSAVLSLSTIPVKLECTEIIRIHYSRGKIFSLMNLDQVFLYCRH